MQLTRRTLKLVLKPMVVSNTTNNLNLVSQLRKLMTQEDAIGLAANQVGLRDRCFVMHVDGRAWDCFNPEVLEFGNDLVEFQEGCLSFKGEQCIIKRPDKITVRYYDAYQAEHVEELTGLASRCFQHELDHLNGITMWDRYKEQNAEQSRD
jgi:peptide deformylase